MKTVSKQGHQCHRVFLVHDGTLCREPRSGTILCFRGATALTAVSSQYFRGEGRRTLHRGECTAVGCGGWWELRVGAGVWLGWRVLINKMMPGCDQSQYSMCQQRIYFTTLLFSWKKTLLLITWQRSFFKVDQFSMNFIENKTILSNRRTSFFTGKKPTSNIIGPDKSNIYQKNKSLEFVTVVHVPQSDQIYRCTNTCTCMYRKNLLIVFKTYFLLYTFYRKNSQHRNPDKSKNF